MECAPACTQIGPDVIIACPISNSLGSDVCSSSWSESRIPEEAHGRPTAALLSSCASCNCLILARRLPQQCGCIDPRDRHLAHPREGLLGPPARLPALLQVVTICLGLCHCKLQWELQGPLHQPCTPQWLLLPLLLLLGFIRGRVVQLAI